MAHDMCVCSNVPSFQVFNAAPRNIVLDVRKVYIYSTEMAQLAASIAIEFGN